MSFKRLFEAYYNEFPLNSTIQNWTQTLKYFHKVYFKPPNLLLRSWTTKGNA